MRLQGSENAKFMVAATTLIFILLFIPFSNLPNEWDRSLLKKLGYDHTPISGASTQTKAYELWMFWQIWSEPAAVYDTGFTLFAFSWLFWHAAKIFQEA